MSICSERPTFDIIFQINRNQEGKRAVRGSKWRILCEGKVLPEYLLCKRGKKALRADS